MRVSTIGSFSNGLAMMQRLQAALDHTQRQVSSGRRILTPSDDPIGATRALELRDVLGRLNQFDRNANVAKNGLSQEESALNSANKVLQRVRELSLQANNATQSNESRQLIAIEMREQLSQLVQIANQQDGNGNHLFAGNMTDVEPVTRQGSSFSYNGDQGQSYIQIGEGRQVADGDSGSAVFFAIRNGNGSFSTAPATSNSGTGLLGASSVVDPTIWNQEQYTVRFIDQSNYEVLDSSATLIATGSFQPGDTLAFSGIEFSLQGQPLGGDEFFVAPSRYQNVFATVDQIATALEQVVVDDVSRAFLNNSVNAGLQNIDQAIGNMLDIRTQVGSRLAVIDGQADSNGAFALTLQETIGGIEDLDYAAALSHLSIEATILEAAQQSFIRTQSLTLFNFF